MAASTLGRPISPPTDAEAFAACVFADEDDVDPETHVNKRPRLAADEPLGSAEAALDSHAVRTSAASLLTRYALEAPTLTEGSDAAPAASAAPLHDAHDPTAVLNLLACSSSELLPQPALAVEAPPEGVQLPRSSSAQDDGPCSPDEDDNGGPSIFASCAVAPANHDPTQALFDAVIRGDLQAVLACLQSGAPEVSFVFRAGSRDRYGEHFQAEDTWPLLVAAESGELEIAALLCALAHCRFCIHTPTSFVVATASASAAAVSAPRALC